MVSLRSFSVVVGVLAARATAACVSYGVDFTNGGKYSIDGSSGKYFSFITVFDGCSQETVSPFLVAPDDSSYACSDINTTPSGDQTQSTCGIPYSSMASGTWKIVLQSSQIAVQRTITLTVGAPKTVTVTVTPTVSYGVTVSEKAKTVFLTSYQTVTQINTQGTVTNNCNSGTQTVTSVLPKTTVTRTSIITRTETRGPVTQTYTTTLTSTASCHLPSTTYVWTTSYVYDTPTNSFCLGNGCGSGDTGGVIIGSGSNGGAVIIGTANNGASSTIRIGKRRLGHVGPDEPAKPAKREEAAVAAKTVTYTQTTSTYTQTSTTTIAATTTTERVFNRATTTVNPQPVTVCNGQGAARQTVTITSRQTGTSTYTTAVYQTSFTTQTVFKGQTIVSTQVNQASSSACWRSGGEFW